MAGLGGERLAIANGDIWTHPLSGGDYVRRVKPEAVQRSLWIPVYREVFDDIRLDEFLHHWRREGEGELSINADNTLTISAGHKPFGIAYQAVTRAGAEGARRLDILPGIPDRYVLEQDISFLCQTPECGNLFNVRIDSQKVQGRCPLCGRMNFETAVAFYGFRSGLPEIGPFAAGDIAQADTQHFRSNSYFFVPDLRVIVEVMLPTAAATCHIVLEKDGARTVLTAGADGMGINHQKIPDAPRLTPGEWNRLEFYRADGDLRLFVNGSAHPVYDVIVDHDGKPPRENMIDSSGVVIMAEGGQAVFREIVIDRDIYYFSGSEQAVFNHLTGMEETGEIDIPPGMFFPLGDNTTVSLDGRSWGAVEESLLRGVAVRIWRPRERAGPIPVPSE